MSTKDDEAIAKWRKETRANIEREKSEYAFYRQMVDCLREKKAFDGCPDSDSLYDIAEYALRLAYVCHKEHPNGGYGIKSKLISAIRSHRRNNER